MLQPETIRAVIEGIAARLPLAPDCEITLEANPGTAEAARFQGYRTAGVNRLSLGIQSFSSRALSALGRIHDGEDGLSAVALAKAAGFHLNLDLMHGLPGQAVAEGQRDIELALDAGISHLSYYQLTIEPNTAFYRRPPTLPRNRSSSASRTGGSACSKQEALSPTKSPPGPGTGITAGTT